MEGLRGEEGSKAWVTQPGPVLVLTPVCDQTVLVLCLCSPVCRVFIELCWELMNRNRAEPARTSSRYPDLAIWVAISPSTWQQSIPERSWETTDFCLGLHLWNTHCSWTRMMCSHQRQCSRVSCRDQAKAANTPHDDGGVGELTLPADPLHPQTAGRAWLLSRVNPKDLSNALRSPF